MRDGIPVAQGITIPRSELTWRFSHASGPGGQSVNTSDSRVELGFDLAGTAAFPPQLRDRALDRLAGRLVGGVLTVVESRQRSQLDNRRAAERRLASVLAEAIAPPPKPRRRTRPSRGAIRARLEAKHRRGQLKRQRRRPEE